MVTMKLFKLIVHERSFSAEDLIINPRDCPSLKKGDIVEIYHPEDEFSRLLLQVTTFKEDLQGKETISVESSIATAFQLRKYVDVWMRIVEPETVGLDSVELTFKDQYMGRSEMWRLKKSLVNTCIYLNKKIEFCGGYIRCQVYEMWSSGERVACGVITENTKIVFRSSTSMVYLFLQMSSEMWDFDIHGDLYFEKAVNGFLADLFQKWKKHGSNHEVTIVLFSRTFYKANSLDEFPKHMRDCLQQDYRGRFYEDFYRVAVQNERYDDWSSTLVQLRRLFMDYQRLVLEYHKRPGIDIPKAENSTAAQGNFLEVLNMSLNVFEKHYLDRSFERTGQLSVVITPGVGVFEVDRQLTNITKQRIIDNGVGSDLVCVGEQPLHAVPLLKFHNKDTSISAVDDYSMPHWINLSFYSTNKKVAYSNFVPRIKLPPRRARNRSQSSQCCAQEFVTLQTSTTAPKTKMVDEEFFPESPFDYDAYDRQVFQLPTVHTTRFSRQLQRASSRHKKGSVTLDGGVSVSISGPGMQYHPKSLRRKISDPDIHHIINGEQIIVGSPSNGHSLLVTSPKMISGGPNVGPPSPLSTLMGSSPVLGSSLTPRSAAISIPQSRSNNNSPQPSLSVNANDGDGFSEIAKAKHRALEDLLEGETSPPVRVVAGSMGSPTSPISPTSPPQNSTMLRPGRALINPFDPSHVTIKLTSNRRRWTHIFPKGPEGVLIQQHHYQAVPTHPSSDDQVLQSQSIGQTHGLSGQYHEIVSVRSTSPVADLAVRYNGKGGMTRSASQIAFQDHVRGRNLGRPQLPDRSQLPLQTAPSSNKALLWGATGEQEWTPALTTGVDWKSLTISACLPITTDYFPDKRSLQNDYVVSDYYLLPDDVNAEFAQRRAIYKKPLTTSEVFRELVSQRLAQGFQLILANRDGIPSGSIGVGGKIESLGTPSSVVGPRTTDMDPSEEYLLSIGRIFHRISLKGSCITVTRYRPRHPYPPFNFHYRYRFQAPDHESYEMSWVSFTTEKLENYNWNYVDHYICTRGDTDFALAEALKYWRFRVLVLPVNQMATRRILEGSEHCDIYVPPSIEDQSQMVKNFLRFIETCVNRIRRPNAHKKHRDPHSFPAVPLQLQLSQLTRRRHSTSLTFLSHPSSSANHTTNLNQHSSIVGNSPFRERLGSNRLPDKPRPRSGSKVLERGRASPAGDGSAELSTNNEHQDWLEDGCVSNEPRLSKSASINDIVDAFRHPSTGVGFLSHNSSAMTFVSADAVQWLIKHVEGTSNQQAAEHILERMLNERLICHASGDFNHGLKIGFYLYHIVSDYDQQKDGDASAAPLGDIQSFENEWLEVEVRHPTNWILAPTVTDVPNSPTLPPVSTNIPFAPLPKFLQDTMEEMCQGDGVAQYKNIHLEIDVNNKSDRVEWGHCRYQSLFRPDRAYELVVQWLAASGPIVAELIVSGWARKAIQCNLQMVPIPFDPLALPFTHKSDPLRGPVFVPLDTEYLMGSKSFLFQEFPEDSWAQRLLLFQETIAIRFGFIACAMENRGTSSPVNKFSREREKEQTRHHHQYVHITGNMFLLIPSPPCPRAHAQDINCQGNARRAVARQPSIQYPTHHDMVSSPHEEYITRHVSGSNNQDEYGPDRKIGFLWSWNHLLTRRWRGPNSATGDEQFQNKMLKDFREFCSNQNNRLLNFWDQCWISRDQHLQSQPLLPHSEDLTVASKSEEILNGNHSSPTTLFTPALTLEDLSEKVS